MTRCALALLGLFLLTGQLRAADPPKPEIVPFEPKTVPPKLDAAVAFEKDALTRMRGWEKPAENRGRVFAGVPTQDQPHTIAFSPKSPHVAALGRERLQIFDYSNRELLWDHPAKRDEFYGGFTERTLTWSTDGAWVALSMRNRIDILDVKERKVHKQLTISGEVVSLTFSADGERFVAVVAPLKGDGLTLKQWLVKDWSAKDDLPMPKVFNPFFTLSASGDYFLLRERKFNKENPPLSIWHLKTGKLSEFKFDRPLENFALHTDDRTLVSYTGTSDGYLRDLVTVDLVTGKSRTIREKTRSWRPVRISPCGKYLLHEQEFVGISSRMQLLDAESGKELWGRQITTSSLWTFGPGGGFLAEVPRPHFGYDVYFLPTETLVNTNWKDHGAKIAPLIEGGAVVEHFGSRVECSVASGERFKKDSFANAVKEIPEINAVMLDLQARSFFEVPAVISSLTKFEKLEELVLVGCRLTADDLKVIGGLKTLKRLEIRDCTRFKSTEFGPLKGLENLEWLKIESQPDVSDDLFDALGELKSLKHLELNTCFKLTNKGGPALAKLKNLESLRLWRAGMNGGILKDLAALEKLRELDTYQFGIIDEDLPEIAKFKNLEALYLHDDQSARGKLTEAGFAKMILPKTVTKFRYASGYQYFHTAGLKGLDLTQFEVLELRGFRLTEGDYKLLVNCPKLKELYIAPLEVRDGLINVLPKIKSLKRVNLLWSQVPEPKLEELRKAMPNVLFWKIT